VAFANWVINGIAPGPVKLITGALAVLGVALLITDGALESLAGDGQGTFFGVILAVICAALGSFYAVMVKPIMGRHGGLKIIALSMMIGGIGLWILVGLGWGIWVNPTTIALVLGSRGSARYHPRVLSFLPQTCDCGCSGRLDLV